MIYKKPLMSISELVEMGFSRYQLKQIIKDPNAPIIRHSQKGKVFFDTALLDDYLMSNKSNKQAHTKIPWSQRKKMLLRN